MSEPTGKKGTEVNQRRSLLKRLAAGAAASAVALVLPSRSIGSSLAPTTNRQTRASSTRVKIHTFAVPRKKAQ